jgi:TIGR03009 family protein
VVFAMGSIILAQSPIPPGVAPGIPSPTPEVDPLIKAHLANWEQVMQGIQNFAIEKCTLERKNLIRKQQTVLEGTIWCMKPNLARLNLTRPAAAGQKADPNDFTAYICDGKSVFEYDGGAKQRTEYKLTNGGVGDNLLLEFISGALKADNVLQRFAVTQLRAEDPNYVFLEIKPLLAKDKVEFDSMILVLYHPNGAGKAFAYLPRTVVIRKSGGQEEETWDFSKPPVMNSNFIKPEHFQAVPPPKDWKIQQAQQAPPPVPAGQPGQPIIRPTGR